MSSNDWHISDLNIYTIILPIYNNYVNIYSKKQIAYQKVLRDELLRTSETWFCPGGLLEPGYKL